MPDKLISEFENIKVENSLQKPDIIELRNITQYYDGNPNPVIKDLNLLIEDDPGTGQYIAILGQSGCGKSTLLRYICGLQKPSSGEILINGKPITKQDRAGMVFQQYSSFPWLTVSENIEFGLKLKGVDKKTRDNNIRDIIQIMNLSGHEHKYAKYGPLSGGQLQRVAIARSLVANPRILMMDEAFGALDIKTRSSMQDMVLSIHDNICPTIVFVTHDISEAVYLSDYVYIMSANPGKIIQKFEIKLGKRDYNTKRTPQFHNYVYEIEDKMRELLVKK